MKCKDTRPRQIGPRLTVERWPVLRYSPPYASKRRTRALRLDLQPFALNARFTDLDRRQVQRLRDHLSAVLKAWA